MCSPIWPLRNALYKVVFYISGNITLNDKHKYVCDITSNQIYRGWQTIIQPPPTRLSSIQQLLTHSVILWAIYPYIYIYDIDYSECRLIYFLYFWNYYYWKTIWFSIINSVAFGTYNWILINVTRVWTDYSIMCCYVRGTRSHIYVRIRFNVV